MIWVIDASVAVRWFLEQESHPHADLVLERMISQLVNIYHEFVDSGL